MSSGKRLDGRGGGEPVASSGVPGSAAGSPRSSAAEAGAVLPAARPPSLAAAAGQPSGRPPAEPAGGPGSARRRPRVVYVFAVLAVGWLLLGAVGGSYQGRLGEVQKNDNAAYLPGSAESTKVDNAAQEFRALQTIPGFVVYQRGGGLTAADKAKITADVRAFAAIPGVDAGQLGPPQFARGGEVANVAVPIIGKDGDREVQGDELVDVEKAVLAAARAGAPAGLVVHSAGPGGLLVAFIEAFSGLDGLLLLAAGLVVVGILLLVYRSPVLWFFPLFSSVLALGVSALIIYPLAKHDVLTLNGQSQGILSVLVIGAGTDYALLLVSRYREELHTHASRVEAMIRAWRGAAPAIIASAVTVILGLLCLSLGELNSTRSLGPVAAIGIACTVLVMLIFLPVLLVLGGRWIFWPRIPRLDHQADLVGHGLWARFAAGLVRRARLAWIVTAVVLLACAGLITTLKVDGLSSTDSITGHPDAIVGQKIFDANFSQGEGAPAVIITNTEAVPAVIAAVSKVDGVSRDPGAVCVEVDYAKLAGILSGGGRLPAPAADGCPAAAVRIAPVDGRIAVDAAIVHRYDTPAAYDTITAIRAAVHPIPGADAIVGGQSAINLDTQAASRHDRNLIIPIVLAVILVVLGVLLRALLAPILLIATVVLSFAATLGVSAVVFNHIFGFANADPGFPLFAFIFLVALGIDYNIFLMTRVREETLIHGTRPGIVRGLAVTGGVITSAGVVLAGTFAVLGVLPLVFLAQVGFSVAFGVLLDTILVRSVLVPALSHDIGATIWWPSKLSRAAP
ncbi:MMPL family transporter [Frankia sp. QA3]|uniref:MMPL family transporter n=1 Tax=Frankia sp. QA3 TaxID=710111 RepID=UPI000269BC17|nr:MMPL family transporter [Frankia sp. QA3]EIV91291.1 putative RND superfamily drug exporter [Frankia sp. QA3]